MRGTLLCCAVVCALCLGNSAHLFGWSQVKCEIDRSCSWSSEIELSPHHFGIISQHSSDSRVNIVNIVNTTVNLVKTVRTIQTHLKGSASAPSLGLDLGLLALGQPERDL